jgi:8-oxo-dGTP diphosphatase
MELALVRSGSAGKADRRSKLFVSETERIRGACLLLINAVGEVLLFLRDDKAHIPYPNRWDTLGGMIEPGESPEECIVREIREEIEFEATAPTLFKVHEGKEGTIYIFWHRAEIDIACTPLHEGQKLKWFSRREIEGRRSDEFAFGFRELLLEFYAAAAV